ILGLGGDRLSSYGQELSHAVIADHLAHGCLGHDPESLVHVAQPEQILVRIADLVLDDPLDRSHVEIAGQHERFRIRLLILVQLPIDVRAPSPETEFLLGLPPNGCLLDPFDAERQLAMRAWIGYPHEAAKARDQTDLVRLDLVVRAKEDNDEEARRQEDCEEPAWRGEPTPEGGHRPRTGVMAITDMSRG